MERGGTLERVSYPRAGGNAYGYRLRQPQPRGRIVAAHGTGNDSLFPLVALFKALFAAGWEVFAFDLDGHGRESTTRWDPAEVAGAIPAALQAADAGGPPLPTHLLGHSLGAALVLRVLPGSDAARVRSAMLLSAPLGIRTGVATGISELRSLLSSATWKQREHYGVRDLLPAVGPFRREAYPFRSADPFPGMFGYVAAVRRVITELDLEEVSRRVSIPTLLVYADRDRLVPPAQGERLATLIPGARLCRVSRASHWTLPFSSGAIAAVVSWLEHQHYAAGCS